MRLKPLSKHKTAPKTPPKRALAGQLTLETYFTHPSFFGVTTATPVQRAKCRIVSGLPLGDLADHPDVLEMCGGTIPTPGVKPKEILDISAIRIGKSLFAAAFITWLTQTVDLSGVIESDIIRLFVVALKLDNTDAVMRHLKDTLQSRPALRNLIATDPEDLTLESIKRSGLQMHTPSGKIVEVRPIPLDRAGGSAVSVFSAGVVVDEYPRMIGADDGVRNVEHFHQAVLGRLLPGAQYLATGSPWHAYGPAYDNTVKYFGRPSEDLVVLRTSGVSFVDVVTAWSKGPNNKEYPHEKLKRRSELAYKTDFLAEFADGDQVVFSTSDVEKAFESRPAEGAMYGKPALFADPSALRHDYWAVIVGGWVQPVEGPLDLFECEFLGDDITPGRGAVVAGPDGWVRILEDENGRPIRKERKTAQSTWFEVYEIVSWDKSSRAEGTDLVKAVGRLGRRYGCEDFHWDGYEQLMLGSLIKQEGLRPVVHSWSGPGRKTEAVDHLRTLFVERRIRLPAHEQMRQELVRFRARATPGGNFQYVVAGGAGHGDHASCLTLAMRADLDGYVDRSPNKVSIHRTEIYDYDDSEDD